MALLIAATEIPEGEQPMLVLSADGKYEDANDAALEILGMSLAELRALPPRALSATPDDEADALREEWQRLGARAAVGETTIVRPDGSRVRARFFLVAEADGRYRAVFRPVRRPIDQPTQLYTIGSVLAAWRAAERQLTALEPGSAEWAEVHDEVAALRAEHRRLFEARQP